MQVPQPKDCIVVNFIFSDGHLKKKQIQLKH